MYKVNVNTQKYQFWKSSNVLNSLDKLIPERLEDYRIDSKSAWGMEGYLNLCTKQLGKTYKARQVWVVLDGQTLTYYDRLDLTLQLPKNVKGVLFIKSAEVSKVSRPSIEFGIKIYCTTSSNTSTSSSLLPVKSSSGSTSKVFFDCVNATNCNTWFNALSRAVKLHEEASERLLLPLRARDTLQIAHDTLLTKSLLSKTYKRLCLTHHPDKGGDTDLFHRLRVAHETLLAALSVEEEARSTRSVQFEATAKREIWKIMYFFKHSTKSIRPTVLEHAMWSKTWGKFCACNLFWQFVPAETKKMISKL